MTDRDQRTEAELFAARDDPDTMRVIVDRYSRIAIHLARRYRGRGEPDDDLQQVAMLGLLKAAERFDVDRGFKFSTFATTTIMGELKRHLRDHTWSVRMPRSLQERWLETSRAAADLTQSLGRSPTIGEIASRIGATQEDVIEALDAGGAYTSTSLDLPVGEDEGGGRLGDLIPDYDEALANADERVTLARHLEALPERERAILYLRFFEGKTQAEIAEGLEISQMHVSRLLSRTLGELRSRLGAG